MRLHGLHFLSAISQFGSANALSRCNEEAATNNDLHSLFFKIVPEVPFLLVER
jgi:hypothetical protein